MAAGGLIFAWKKTISRSPGLRIVLSGIFVTQNPRAVRHIVAQYPVCGCSCLYTLDGDHENPGILAFALWGKKEEYLRRNARSYSGEPVSSPNRDCIYHTNAVRSRWEISLYLLGGVVPSLLAIFLT
jgi:hypothetical protein